MAAAVAAFLPALGAPFRGWFDFSAFYAAGSLAFTPQVAQLRPIVTFESQRGLPLTPFVYPADVALLYVPFSWLPYGVAAAVHLALMLGILVLAAIAGARLLGMPRRWVVLGALAWGPAAAGVVSGQNTSLALLLVVASAAALIAASERRAGALAGLLAYKPQLAAPIAGLLLVRGRWVAIAALVAVLIAHYVGGVVATGGNLSWPRDWLQTLSSYTAADFGQNGWQAISLPAIGTRLELVTGVPYLALIGYGLGVAVVLRCLPALRRLPPLESVALACALGLVVSPHAWVYDATLLLPAAAVFARRASARGWTWQDRWLLAGAYAISLTWPFGGLAGLTLVPILVLAAPWALVRGPATMGRQAGMAEASAGVTAGPSR
jgi:alpha-1,2-mannosyltransferase